MTYSKSLCFTGIFLCLVSFQSCKDDEDAAIPEDDFVSDFYSNTSSLELIIGYEEGAEPYTQYNNFTSWDVCESNLTNLLESKKIIVTAPKSLDDMTALGQLEQNNYTRENLVSLAADLQKFDNKGLEKGITIIFLNGYYIRNGVPENRILGVNLDGTPILAIFKPVVESASNTEAEKALIEQSTITHEIGHALGLVNNGVRATSAHHDGEHGAHCTNTDCVMYWQNGGAEIQQFVKQYLQTGNIKLFGNQCIADVVAK